MTIAVYTQHMENYGAEENTNYWKFKWGDTYIVEGTDERPANAVALVTNHIAKYNSDTNYAIEYVCNWERSSTPEIHQIDTNEIIPPIYLKYIEEIA